MHKKHFYLTSSLLLHAPLHKTGVNFKAFNQKYSNFVTCRNFSQERFAELHICQFMFLARFNAHVKHFEKRTRVRFSELSALEITLRKSKTFFQCCSMR